MAIALATVASAADFCFSCNALTRQARASNRIDFGNGCTGHLIRGQNNAALTSINCPGNNRPNGGQLRNRQCAPAGGCRQRANGQQNNLRANANRQLNNRPIRAVIPTLNNRARARPLPRPPIPPANA
ncbi:hypothetical protein PYCC9005_001218 [Savitreella phatthalungensis]